MKTLLLCLIILLSINCFSSEIIKFSEDPWPPYTLGRSGEEPSGGVAVDFVKEISRRVGFIADIKLFPWKRCLKQMESGHRDGILLLTKSSEREEYMVFSEKIMDDRDLIWYSKKRFNNFNWEKFEDLSGLVIGKTAGYNYGEEFNAAVLKHKLNVQIATADLLNFRKLLKGRTDIFICNETVARSIFSNYPEFKNELNSAENPLKVVEFYLALSRKSDFQKYILKINTAIKEMKEDGTIQKILERMKQ